MRDIVKIFKALSDPNRLRILKMLEIRPLCVCEIREILGLANSTVSKHLSLLRDVDFILDHKEGRWVYYRLNTEQTTRYIDELAPLISRWLEKDELVSGDKKRAEQVERDSCTI
ncbi:MAG: ArsR family transcriptional regulator [Calditrichaeota bacterium]|nr:MAG: ArsR family transcriptional regulator [Calditrichota bacterium]